MKRSRIAPADRRFLTVQARNVVTDSISVSSLKSRCNIFAMIFSFLAVHKASYQTRGNRRAIPTRKTRAFASVLTQWQGSREYVFSRPGMTFEYRVYSAPSFAPHFSEN